MSYKTKIEWTEATWNPITGCSKVSPGCKYCYAERISNRFGKNFNEIIGYRSRFNAPLHWKKSKMIFVCSMSDLFHEKIPFKIIDKLIDVMAQCKQHIFQILTKRPERMSEYFVIKKVPNNIWLGISCEDQLWFDKRLPYLYGIDCDIKFVSLEPLLYPIDLSMHLKNIIDWVVVGSESGPNRRPANIDWIRGIRYQCEKHNIPLFIKQMEIDGRLVKMPELDGKVWGQYPNRRPEKME